MGFFDFFKKQNADPKWITMFPKEMSDMLLEQIRSNPQACKLDEIPHGIGRFGFDKTNPIPVFGIPENEEYLSRLKRSSGEGIRWRRITSLEIDTINCSIDEYEIFNLQGDTLAVIYISPYHLKTSEKAPAGFKIV